MVSTPTRIRTLLRFLPAIGASLATAYVIAAGDLDSIPRGIAIACVAASWIAPLFFSRREVGTHGTVVVGIAGVVAAGQTRIGPFYGVLAALFLIGCLVSMRAARRSAAGGTTTAPLATNEARTPRRILIIFPLVALPITTVLLLGLPWLAARIERRFNGMLSGENGLQATAFSTSMILGATRGMYQSDAVVMRIDGADVEGRKAELEYLRGAVYDDYDGGSWSTSFTGAERTIIDSDVRVSDDDLKTSRAAWRMTLSRSAPRGNDMRWFLPPHACDLGTKERLVQIDAFGVSRRAMNEEVPQVITFHSATTTASQKNCKHPPRPPLAPTFRDQFLSAYRASESLKRQLTPIAEEWTANLPTKRAKLAAIRAHLSQYEYSLAVERTPNIDPIVDFLTIHKAGHCEYFASAMVLLARTQGISARVVGGYHTSEVNPLTNQIIVRDRNAHTWVEAWIDDVEDGSPAAAWHAYDPTPAIEAYSRGTSRWDHVSDLLSFFVERGMIALKRLGPLGLAAVLAVGLGAFYAGRAILRWMGTRLRNRRKRGDRKSDLPLPSFVTLESALRTAGHVRDESEPIESFARRLTVEAAGSGSGAIDAVTKALRRYADLRYGGIGDERAVEKAIADATTELLRQ